MRWTWPRIQLKGLNRESSIHSQASALRATGVVHGRRMRKRTNHLPRKFAESTKPRMVASTITTACAITVKTTVLRSATWKTGSAIVF